MNTEPQICFEQRKFNAFAILFVLITSVLFVLYIECDHKCGTKESFTQVNLNKGLDNSQLMEKLKKTQDDLHACQINNEFCKSDLAKAMVQGRFSQGQNAQAPTRDYASNDNYTQIGLLYNDTGRFPLYGRRKYPGRSEKWEYYTIDDSRNQLRIEVNSQNYNELYTGDSVNVPILDGDFNVEIYKYDNFRYIG